MACRRVVAGSARGGAGIQTPRVIRLITGLAAIAALSGAGALAVTSSGALRGVEAGVVGFAELVLLAGLLLRRAGTIPWAVVFVVTAYLTGHAGRHAADRSSAVAGVLLLVAAELASWSIDQDRRVRPDRSLLVRRGLILAALAAGALAVDALLLALTGVTTSSRLVLAVVGTGAVFGAVTLVLGLVRRTAPKGGTPRRT